MAPAVVGPLSGLFELGILSSWISPAKNLWEAVMESFEISEGKEVETFTQSAINGCASCFLTKAFSQEGGNAAEVQLAHP